MGQAKEAERESGAVRFPVSEGEYPRSETRPVTRERGGKFNKAGGCGNDCRAFMNFTNRFVPTSSAKSGREKKPHGGGKYRFSI